MRESDDEVQDATEGRAWRAARAGLLLALSMATTASGQSAAGQVRHAEIGPGIHLLSNDRGNLVLRVGTKESFVVGAQRPELVSSARALIARLHAPAVRFAVALAAEDAARFGDGGWGAGGAVTLAHEGERARMADARSTALPTMGFSEVVQIGLSGEEAHVVHQPAGYSAADAIVHFEREGVLVLGADFTTNGYPDLDLTAGGSLAGMIKTIDTFMQHFGASKMQFVPIRGPVANGATLREYHDMLVTVRDRVAKLVASGASERDVVAAKPTSPLDARWGRGPVSGDRFAAIAFHSLAGR